MPDSNAELRPTQAPLSLVDYEAAQEILRFCADARIWRRLDYESLSLVARLESVIYRQLARGVQ
jgi:hypothetical protein